MRAVLQLIWLFVAFERILWQTVVAGAAIFVSGFALYVVSEQVARLLLTLGYAVGFVMPLLVAPFIAVGLARHKRCLLVPNIPLHVNLALLVMTLMASVASMAGPALLGRDPLAAGMMSFIGFSFYLVYVQTIARLHPALLAAMYLLPFCAIVLASENERIAAMGAAASSRWLSDLLIAALAGWGLSFIILCRRGKLAPVYRQRRERGAIGTLEEQLTRIDGVEVASLLYGYPLGVRARVLITLSTLTIPGLYVCLAMTLVWWLVPATASDRFEGFQVLDLFLIVSLAMVQMMVVGLADVAARARLLWLRHPGNREHHWRSMEACLWTLFGQIVLSALVPAAVVAFFLDWRTVLLYLGLLIVTSPLILYAGIVQRTHGFRISMYAVQTVVLAATLFALWRGAAVPSAYLVWGSAVALGATLGLRLVARRGFTAIDWMRVRMGRDYRGGLLNRMLLT